MSEEQPELPGGPGDAGDAREVIVDAATDEVLRLHLDRFEGPLELLLYLIKVQEIDIFDIPIVTITDQYLRFLDVMREENLDVTGEFLVLAATLIQIKSRMLLPADEDTGEEEEFDEEDPRAELVEKLLEYRKYQEVTQLLEDLEEARQQWFMRHAKPPAEAVAVPEDEEEMLEVTLYDLTEAFRNVLRFFTDDLIHTVHEEGASVDEKIEHIESRIASEGSVAWTDLFRACRSRVELVCCFLAILELCRMGRIRAHQHRSFDDIRLFPAGDNPQPPQEA
jgi:segregation and condensation protein A